MEESGRVRPIHHSVREFLTKPVPVGISPIYKDWVFEFKASKCHLAVACLARLKKAEIAVRQYDLHYLLKSRGGLIRLLSDIDYPSNFPSILVTTLTSISDTQENSPQTSKKFST